MDSPLLATTTPALSPHAHDSSPPECCSADFDAYAERVLSTILRDYVGRRDFALYADGGGVMDELTVPFPSYSAEHASNSSYPPEIALQDDMRVGKCWFIPSQRAQLAIVLPRMVYPTHVTVDHIPLVITADIGEAPRNMRLWGMIDGLLNRARHINLSSSYELPSADGRHTPPLAGDRSYVLLSEFQYDINALSPIQTFHVDLHIIDSRMYFGVVVLEIVDNWGSNTTCLYRVRVHGDPKEP
ncbi:uncharacterized protein TRAVEDRAFT_111609 [Trametes versicolor FP-101664 SS1]|uniref:uncharacterized protein n=1 Tax=Trametes versicolor (strain FP-101664) TaxID=717944 RepID=UPI000462253D|nr:uncharacterized protein TRAVEDRAFT_111609 [Trametes versicolor FP-101664 SS1]EIW65128.1 hypothetical protein TRAVEDRAFT_111609 [Trametes versicolor FP-101664 SS1]